MSTTNTSTDTGGSRDGSTGSDPGAGRTAGLADIRNIIGGLLGIYGVILLLVGALGDAEESKTGGINANLWAGIVLIVVSAVFIAWARLRPVQVEPGAGSGVEDAHAHMDTR